MPRRKKLSTVVSTNDRRASLIALRDRLARAIDETDSGRDIAALSKRMMEVMDEIDHLPDPNASESALDMARKAARNG